MAATPKTGQMFFLGSDGKNYIANIYNPDVSGSFIGFNLQGAAGSGSNTYLDAPVDLTLVDTSVVTGIVDTTTLVAYNNAAIRPGVQILWANVVNTLPSRIFPRFTIPKGSRFQMACA